MKTPRPFWRARVTQMDGIRRRPASGMDSSWSIRHCLYVHSKRNYEREENTGTDRRSCLNVCSPIDGQSWLHRARMLRRQYECVVIRWLHWLHCYWSYYLSLWQRWQRCGTVWRSKSRKVMRLNRDIRPMINAGLQCFTSLLFAWKIFPEWHCRFDTTVRTLSRRKKGPRYDVVTRCEILRNM